MYITEPILLNTTAEKLLLKRQIVDAGIRKQESIINDFRERIADVLANEGNVNEEEYDSHLQSFKSEGIAEVNLLNNELLFAIEELRELKRIECTDEHHPATVQFSAVVETDRGTFFVAVSLEKFSVGHQTIFGVSVNSAIYKAMKGRKIGESFTHKGLIYHINDIF